MRIFNGTTKFIDMPLSGIQRLQIAPKGVSADFMPNSEFLSLLVSSYDYNEIALIVSGPYEINMCSSISGSVGFVVQSLEEAIERFSSKEAPVEPTQLEVIEEIPNEPTPEEVKEEVKETQEEVLEEAPQVEEIDYRERFAPILKTVVKEEEPTQEENPQPKAKKARKGKKEEE